MELALLVYVISVFGKLHEFFAPVMFFAGLIFVVGLAILSFASLLEQENYVKHLKSVYLNWFVTPVIVFGALVLTFVPTEKTAYIMVGAYATQQIAENPRVLAAGDKVFTIIEQKLEQFVDEGAEELVKFREERAKASEKTKEKTK